MRLYAYKDHELFNHLEDTATEALNALNRLGYNVICNRFRKLGLEIGSEELKEIVRLSALLHDIGKAADKYQSDRELESFYLHEIPSAVIAKRVLEESIQREEQRDLIVITVLQHMNSMRDWLSNYSKDIERYNWRFARCNYELLNFLKNITKVDNINIKLEVSGHDAIELINEYKEKSRDRNRGWLKLYNFILALISVGDNIDAYKARGDSLSPNRRWFIKELMMLEEY